MDTQDSITKVTQTLERADGSQVRIVAQACFGAGLHRSIDVYVLRRKHPDDNWTVCSDQPHPDWRTMSVDEYLKRGRSEKFQAASHGEIFKVSNLIGKPMSTVASTNSPANMH